ncbi:MAG TPA: aminotransferase class III-fold pyridoxal phosphate-dependent enzyme [Candidatus Hydrogenedentes bacterium]|nr:aminotransferase class III-fold pyridoxal phosphate-dependent enzyme [Candidatus Hydrogenedentota bacterium]
MKKYEYSQSAALFARAAKVIPCGVYGHFSPAPCVPVAHYPFFTARAKGSHFWDVDGNDFIDYMCAYGPMVLGYMNRVVDAAYAKQMALADSASTASPRMVELAELLVDLVPVADWAFFAKNGADVTNYAVMTARAATGRKKVVGIIGGYHGTSPWMQAPGHHGVVEDDHKNVIRIPWNDVGALERTIAANPGQIAAFISTPYHHPVFADNELPADGYWQKVETLLRRHGIVFIVDDVRCGFRLDMGGSNEYFGFKPDLICFCKAIGNGYPISALVGTDALKNAAAKVFHTGSYWFSAGPMAAAIACLKELKRLDGPRVMMEKGTKLLDGMVKIAKSHGYTLKVSGAPSMPYLRITDDPSLMFHQRLCGECTRRGAFFTSHHNWFLSTAHTDKDIQRTWNIFDDAFAALLAKPVKSTKRVESAPRRKKISEKSEAE